MRRKQPQIITLWTKILKINAIAILEDRAKAKNQISNNFIGFVLHENLLGKSFNIGHKYFKKKKTPNNIIQPPVSRKLKN